MSAPAAASGELGPPRVGISACLLGERVRYDGGHKRDDWAADELGRFVQWVPLCPELEAGLGVPRPALQLVREGEAVRLLEVESRRDHSARMRRTAARLVRELRALELCGYLFKKNSPSCGVFRVKLYGESGPPERSGQGLFAAAVAAAFPQLPIEEEGRLQDALLRESFIERLFAYQRLRALFRGRWTSAQLIAFHTAHKLQLLAHVPASYTALGREVAALSSSTRAALRMRYEREFMAALARSATRGRTANALQHAAGHLKQRLEPGCRAELADAIDAYRRGELPLAVPLTLLAHHARVCGVEYLRGQTLLAPHPAERMLRARA